MWVVVILAGCEATGATSLRWSFADHRTCAEANVVTIAVRDDEREVVRGACADDVLRVGAERAGDALVVEALGYHDTALYRGRVVVKGDDTAVTLRYVGGRSR